MRSVHGALAAPLFQTSLVAAVIGFGVYFDDASARAQEPEKLAEAVQSALEHKAASPQVRGFAQWVLATHDNAGQPFIVVDKAQARVYAFGPLGQLRATAPVILGAARADDSVPPATPAGRFTKDSIQQPGAGGMAWSREGVQLLVHPLPAFVAAGDELQLLGSPGLEARRTSEGTIHVAAGFWREHIDPLRSAASIAYVLPEAQQVEAVATPATTPHARQRETHIAQSSTRRLS
jgi:hypothetical protein